ncbi:MAG: urease accessory protein UreD [Cyanobacteria bacterium J06626_14]
MNVRSTLQTGWHGTLDLVLDAKEASTYVQRCHAQAPLKFQRPFYPEGPTVCHGVMLHTAGGIAGGDRLSTTIRLGESAHGLLTTAAATKVYRSSVEPSVQTTTMMLEQGARLEWFPQESILFNGAQYHQHTQVTLEPGAIWMGWELIRLGRSARGEHFDYGDWRSHTEIWRAQQPSNVPLWIDRQFINGGTEMLHQLHGLSGCPVVGSFACVGISIESTVRDHIRTQWQNQYPHLSASLQSSVIGVTRLREGIVCRYRGSSTAEARSLFMTAWDVVRKEILSLVPHRPRTWSI